MRDAGDGFGVVLSAIQAERTGSRGTESVRSKELLVADRVEFLHGGQNRIAGRPGPYPLGQLNADIDAARARARG